MKDGLIDLLVVSGYFRLNPWETTVKLGHQYGVPVYPCLSETRIKDKQAHKARASLECYRARAANVWASGADGVYLFNYFNPNSPLWRQLGDPKTLAGLDKVYTTGARGISVINRWMAGGMRFFKRSHLSPERPRKLEPGKPVTVELPVGEDLGAAAPKITLRLRIDKLGDAKDVSVKLNDQPMSGGALKDAWVEYALTPTLVKRGVNRFEFTLNPASKAKPVLQDLLLWVRYEKG